MHMRWKRDGRKRDGGAAAVEFALVFPIFLVLLLATIDFGYFFYISEVVTNAAREGARAGSVVDPGDGEGAAVGAAEARAKLYLSNVGLQTSGVSARVDVDGLGERAVFVAIDYKAGSVTGFFPPSIIPEFSRARAVMRWQ